MKLIKSCCFVLLAGTCTGAFFYLQTVPFLRIAPETGGAAEVFWAFTGWAQAGAYLLAANAALLLIWLGYSWLSARFAGIRLKAALQADADTYLPLCILALPLLQFSPLLTRYFEGLLLLSQNAGYLLLLLAFIGVYHLKAAAIKNVRTVGAGRPSGLAKQPPTRQTKVMVFLISFLLYALVGFRVSDPARLGPGGDEPHYLLITHSLLHDHDLQITNNYKQRDYQAFFSGELKPHVSIGRHGVRYPGHPLGLPVLLLPAYALDGYRGAVLLMNGFAALLAVQLYLLAFAFTQHRRLALLLWGIVSFTSPLLLYSSQIYPEIPSALLLAVALRIIIQPLSRPYLLGVALALLPWLQQRMILPAVLLFGYYVFSLKDRHDRHPEPFGFAQDKLRHPERSRRTAAIPGALLALSGLALAGFYFSLYKNPLPNAPYTSVGLPNVFSLDILLKQGLLGLLCDQEAGLFIYAPYFVFLLPGFCWLFRRRLAQACWLMLIIASIYIPCGGFILQWRGAWSPVARYMVALIPFFLIPLSLCLSQLTRPVYRYAFFFCTVISFAWAALFFATPFAAIMSRGGINGVFEASSGLVDLPRYFPLFTEAGIANPGVTGIWLALIAAFTVAVYRSLASVSVPLLLKSAQSRVWAGYGLLLGIFLSFTVVAGYRPPQPLPPLLNEERGSDQQNRQWHTLLTHFQDFAVGNGQHAQFQALTAETFRFEYLNEEKFGQVGPGKARFIVTGPREPFPRGKYTAYFQLVVADNTTTEEVAILDIVARRGTVIFNRRHLRGVDFSQAGQRELVPLAFQLDRDVTDLETRVYFRNRVDVQVQKIYLAPDLAELWQRAGTAALQAENYAAAQTMFRNAAALSDRAEAVYQVGVMEQRHGNWEAAGQAFQQALAREPKLADAYYRLGLARQVQQDWEQARQAFEQATRLLPTHSGAWRALQAACRRLNLTAEAENAAQTMSRLYQPQYPFAVNFGNQMMFMGYRVQNPSPGKLVLDYYWQALTLMPEDYAIFVHFNRFGTKFQQDHLPEKLDAATGRQQVYPTRQWQPGELVREHFEITAPAGTFDLVLGVWEPRYTQTHLAVIAPAPAALFRQTEISLGQITVK